MTTLPQDSGPSPSPSGSPSRSPRPLRFTVLAPLALFLALAALFFFRLLGPTDHSILPSVLKPRQLRLRVSHPRVSAWNLQRIFR